MRFSPFAIAVIIAATIAGCSFPGKTPAPFRRSTLLPDSVSRIPIKGFYVGGFAFSPIEQDKIWFTGVGDPKELDLRTGQAAPLIPRLGEWAGSGFRDSSDWATDPYEPDCIWFARFHDGAVRWNHKTGQIVRFHEARPASCFFFQPDFVWVGTANGLYRYTRRTGVMIYEKNFPAEWVNHLFFRGDTLIANDKTWYLPSGGQYGEWRAPWTDVYCKNFHFSAHRAGHTLLSGNGDNGPVNILWARSGQLYQFGSDFMLDWAYVRGDEVWGYDRHNNGTMKLLDLKTGETWPFYFSHEFNLRAFNTNSNYVFCRIFGDKEYVLVEKRSGESFVVEHHGFENARSIEMDDYNVYVLFEDRFEIINLKWMISKSTPKDRYLQRIAAYRQVGPQFDLYEYDFYTALKKFDDLRAQFGGQQDQWIEARLENAWSSALGTLYKSGPDTLDLVARDWKAGKFAPGQEADVAAALFQYYGRHALLKQAETWGEICIKQVDALRGYRWTKSTLENALHTVERTRYRLDSLDRLQPAPDARLMGEADIFLDYCRNSGWFDSEACYDIRLATQCYQKIIREYPQGGWADNAEFALLGNTCYGCGEGPGIEEARQYEQLLKKYPDSDLKPQIWLTLASIYFSVTEYEQDESLVRTYLQQSQRYFDLAAEAAPDLVKNDNNKWLSEHLAAARERTGWRFLAEPEKATISPGAPARLILSIKNETKQVRKLQLWSQGYGMLYVQGTYLSKAGCEVQDAPFFSGEKPAPDERVITVSPGETHRIVVDISKNANLRGRYGRFDFSQPGVYDFTVELQQPGWDRTALALARVVVAGQ